MPFFCACVSDIGVGLLQFANIQANYHRQSLKLLDQVLPSLTEEIGECF